MASLTDWLARTFFISQDAEDTSNQVQAAQQAQYNQELAQGKLAPQTAIVLQDQITNEGTTFFDQQLGKSGAAGLPGLAFSYWYIWLAIGVAAFLWLGGWEWVRGILDKKK